MQQTSSAWTVHVRGIVQGVGFRPFVFRLALAHDLKGWVLNGSHGVEIRVEGRQADFDEFLRELQADCPAAARIVEVDSATADWIGFSDFRILNSERLASPTTQVSPDLAVCRDCLEELFEPTNRRFHYPYINCTNCGPRYSVILGLPYDRPNTTMRDWPMDSFCREQYEQPSDRRFHAQPVACPNCGPGYSLLVNPQSTACEPVASGHDAIAQTAWLLKQGKIVAVKGLGGYHLACDARNPGALMLLRERKFRKEKPFAVMARDLECVRELVHLSQAEEQLLCDPARPIVLAAKKQELAEVAPDNDELGVMLPYTPLHALLFAAGAPEALVMTSANHSSEPIAFEDSDALQRLSGIADAFLVGERPIARRVDDSVARVGVFGTALLRRSRGYAPAAVASIPCEQPILALGADLKNAITLVVDGQAFVSQYIGDLDHLPAFQAFEKTVQDLLSMYEVRWEHLFIVHDSHPQYRSTMYARSLPACKTISVQHHRAHIASVLAERGAWDEAVVGVSLDGTGFGDDGSIWGGEFLAGSISEGFQRVAHLRQALLPGGDAAARYPVQAAAGFLYGMDNLPDVTGAPFHFGPRYLSALKLAHHGVRCFPTSSMGRLFDVASALLGFTRETTYEGQAAIWLEHMAKKASNTDAYPFPFVNDELDFHPLLRAVIADRAADRPVQQIARAFQRGIADGVYAAIQDICASRGVRTVILSGGVFQNELLMTDLKQRLDAADLQTWTNRAVPTNDGGISLGQAGLGAMHSATGS